MSLTSINSGLSGKYSVIFSEGKSSTSINGVSSNPIKGTTNIDVMSWSRIGGWLDVMIHYNQLSSGITGGGNYYFELPHGFVVDSSRLPEPVGSYSTPALGAGTIHESGIKQTPVVSIFLNGGISYIAHISNSNNPIFGQASGYTDLSKENTHISLNARLPIL